MNLCLINVASMILCFAPQNDKDSFKEPSSEAARQGLSRMHQHQMMSPDKLNANEREVYSKLSTTYKRVFLYAFSSEQRSQAVYLVAHGRTPHEAVNAVLNRSTGHRPRQTCPCHPLSPAEKSMQ